MASELDEMRLSLSQIRKNKARRLLLCLCIDKSTSMSMDQRMSTVNQGIEAFLQRIQDDLTAKDAIEVCLITFGEGAELLHDFGPLQRDWWSGRPLRATDSRSEMGAGVLLALEQMKQRKQLLTDLGISCFRPWLFLISDGAATDIERCRQAGARVKELLQADKLRVKCVGISETLEDMRIMREFTLNGQVDQMDSLELVEFFEMLSRSVSAASRQSIQRGELEKNWV